MENIQLLQITPSLDHFDQLISQIFNIANGSAFPNDAQTNPLSQVQQAGFLVSAYDQEDYLEFGKKGRLHAVMVDQTPAAFSITYRPDEAIDEGDFTTISMRENEAAGPIVKQICTASNQKQKGFARMLYQRFFAQYPNQSVYAAIVEVPRNLGSEKFHAQLGFSKVREFQHPDGRQRGIWCRPIQAP